MLFRSLLTDPDMGDVVKVTAIATGFDVAAMFVDALERATTR